MHPALESASEYMVDAWQRNILYTDVMRQRGNQYQRHMAKKAPNVLSMKAELVLDGRTLKHPVNYMLTLITPPKDMPIDPIKRPFVVVDPRAGHGPGIAGFKPESEIGVAVAAGHPCYFIGFLPQPEPEQTVEDVAVAETIFLEEVIKRHPDAEGKPVVIGNCQAGWQIMMAAAARPELFGPIIIAGAPLSYWAGWRGKNPMRYSGGLAGGSWLTMLASDLGGGKFDGATLVQNFEGLNPANTYWSKQYNLYSNVDTEATRYLGFERWWGGHVFLNGKEIQYIVDNLFIGNRLSSARLVTRDGVRLDLRNIKSPIIVFCSKGDDITPPPQALGWILDLYQNDDEILAHGQTIVYAVHESIGHLGIFVSGAIAKKEHREFTTNIDMIDLLPAGIYEAVIRDKTPETHNADLAFGDYIMTFERRHLSDIEKIVEPNIEDDRRFATVSRISQVNQGLYKSFLQPLVKMMVTPQSTELMQKTNKLRLPYETMSDKNPLIASLAPVAVQVKNHRQAVSTDNPFLQFEKQVSKSIESTLDIWGQWRDSLVEQTFMTVYGSSLVQDLAGLGAKEGAPRSHPGVSPEHIDFVNNRRDELQKLVSCGGLREASIRVLMYISQAQGGVDERSFNLIRRLRSTEEQRLTLDAFKRIVREQAMVMVVDPHGAIEALPTLLESHSPDALRHAIDFTQQVAMASGTLNEVGHDRLKQVIALFEQAARTAERRGKQPQMESVSISRSMLTDEQVKQLALPDLTGIIDQVLVKKPVQVAATAVKKTPAKAPVKPAAKAFVKVPAQASAKVLTKAPLKPVPAKAPLAPVTVAQQTKAAATSAWSATETSTKKAVKKK
jgi:pimeloyl-ACP methyl ester carboxylesterase